jgi:hypothetical protein
VRLTGQLVLSEGVFGERILDVDELSLSFDASVFGGRIAGEAIAAPRFRVLGLDCGTSRRSRLGIGSAGQAIRLKDLLPAVYH